MNVQELLSANRDAIIELASKYGAHNIRVFGSTARDEATPESDIDLLVEMDKDRSLIDQITLKQEIEALLGRRVDLVTEQSIYWLLRRRILREAVPL